MMEAKLFQIIWKMLFFTGWALFWCSLALPVNTSIGGLNDVGTPYSGFVTLFYSIIAPFMIPEAVFGGHDLSFTLGMILMAGVGVCNLIMIFSPLLLLLNFRKRVFSKYLMAGCAIYICIFGSIVSYHFSPIRYGHFVGCLSFIFAACGIILKNIDSWQSLFSELE